jgi:hypothetical protein
VVVSVAVAVSFTSRTMQHGRWISWQHRFTFVRHDKSSARNMQIQRQGRLIHRK